VFTLEQLYELRRFITNCIEEVEEGIWNLY
jgi:hypothetical protein